MCSTKIPENRDVRRPPSRPRLVCSEDRMEVDMTLKGKHALITGGSRGIGRGIALKLAELGVDLAINYVQNKEAATDTLAQIRARGADGILVQADVSRPEEVRGMLAKVEAEFSSLDIFISTARPELPAFYSPPFDITLEQWDTAMDTQAKAFLPSCRLA